MNIGYRDKSSIYYLTMTIWYAISQLQGATWNRELLDHLHDASYDINNLSQNYPDHIIAGQGDRETIVFLQWYHYGSMQKLNERGYISLSDPESKTYQLCRAAMIISATKLSSGIPYSTNDEIIDRLSFLAGELDLDTTTEQDRSLISLTARRVGDREFTRYLNPGCLDDGEDGSAEGPWEINALCHHSRLVLVLHKKYDVADLRSFYQRSKEMHKYKEKICHFLNSEATLVA